MRFLVDAQLPPALCDWLRERRHEAVHVFEAGMIAASDEAIAARAEADGAVLISKDEDFVTLRLPDRFAFLWLRCGSATNRALTAWLEARWERIEALLEEGERFVEVR
jgi:predicted nuclease of predicted toxin-antitoxin system